LSRAASLQPRASPSHTGCSNLRPKPVSAGTRTAAYITAGNSVAVTRLLVVERAAAVATCEPIWLRTRCSKSSQKRIADLAVAWRLVESAAAVATCKPVWLRTRRSRLSLKPVSAITFAHRLVVETAPHQK